MPTPIHHSKVLRTPWPGVHATQLESGRHFARHWHATYGFGLLDDGAQRSASGRGMVDAYAGQILTTNPGEVHDGRPLGSPARRWRMLYLEPAALAELSGQIAAHGDLAFTQPAIADAALRPVLQRLMRRLQVWDASTTPRAPDTASALACDETMVQACTLLLARHATAAPAWVDVAGNDMRQVRDRLAASLQDAPSLAELAALAGLGKYQLLRRFCRVYGVTPYAWLLQHRAETARALIQRGTGLAQAAAASGFADQSHMTRVFARLFGLTPGQLSPAADRAGTGRARLQ